MASVGTSKTSCKHPCDKSVWSNTSNLSLDESDTSIHTHDIHINGNTYVNTPSPSSIASIGIIDRPFKYRSSRLKNEYRSQIFSKRRYRNDRLFHHTHSLNRQYVIAMTNILFQMQKEIYKLKRRTHHVEQLLAKQTQTGHPIIRIPRLTRDEISTICVNNNDNQQTIGSVTLRENESMNKSKPPIINSIESLDERKDDAESSTKSPSEHLANEDINNPQEQSSCKMKYCSACRHEFSHRSGYLRHIKNLHHGIIPTTSDADTPVQIANPSIESISLTTDQSSTTHFDVDNFTDNESVHLLVNHWDIGEGRLRPRPTPKLTNERSNKVKCDICGKFFRAEYIKKHKRRTHYIARSSSSPHDFSDISEQMPETLEKPLDEIQTTFHESSADNADPPSTVTVAEMDIDDMPIECRRYSNKPITIATTCLERYQLDIIDEFIHKFSPHVSQTTSIDAGTTHLITNDDKRTLRSPLSMKLIEGVANHCFCVSYRWIIDCLKYDRIVDESRFEIEGDDSDGPPHGGPKHSRLIDKRHALFENIRFMIKCTENNDIKLTNDRLEDLITTCGGQIISCVTQTLLNQYTIVVLCDKPYVSERRHNYDQCRSLGIHFVSSDWVLESILEYRQKDLALFQETPL